MYKHSFNIIGAGRLGKHLAKALILNELGDLQSVVNQHYEKALAACRYLEAGTAIANLKDLAPADITWITCNDDALKEVVLQLSSQQLKPQSIIMHCSGALSSEILMPLKQQGCYIASFHPLKAFSAQEVSNNAFDNLHCIIEGDVEACSWLRNTFKQLNATLIDIHPSKKAAYHAGACMASNYLITLAHCAEHLFLQAGIEPDKIRPLLTQLMQSNMANLVSGAGVKEVLTGPIARGDINTITLHKNAITDAHIREFYMNAGLMTAQLTSLSPTKKELICDILNDEL